MVRPSHVNAYQSPTFSPFLFTEDAFVCGVNDRRCYILASFLASPRLTAFVVKMLAMADKLVAVQSSVICDAVQFLISRAQERNGLFRELGRVSHRPMMVCALTSFQHLQLLTAVEAHIYILCVCVCRVMSLVLILMPP